MKAETTKCRAARRPFVPVFPDEPSTYYRVDRPFHKRRTDRLDLRENLSHPLRGTRVCDCGLRTRVRHHKLEIAYRGLRKLSADDICPSDPYLTFYRLYLPVPSAALGRAVETGDRLRGSFVVQSRRSRVGTPVRWMVCKLMGLTG
jgi:hypothetical protein